MFFSVIVPVYKVEKYLARCIDSVLTQSFDDFELILVDDGSPDKCPAICDEYAKTDSRIKVIHKKNGGLTSARQAGIKIAEGDYVFNLDSDDVITNDALESIYQIVESTKADIVSFSYLYCKDGMTGKKVEDVVEEGLYQKADIQKYIFPKLLLSEDMKHIFYFLAGKAIRRSLMLKHQLNVNEEIFLGEDLSCSIPCFLQAERVYMSKKAVYLYMIRDDSHTASFQTEKIIGVSRVIKGLRSMDVEKPDDFEEQISRYSCFMCFVILAAAAEGNHFDNLKELENLILNSEHKTEIQKAKFAHITPKSRISIFLMKKQNIRLTFYFLYLCKEIRRILKKG